MPEKPFTSSPNSPRRFCSAKDAPRAPAAIAPGTKKRGPLLLCPADLPGVSLAVAHIHPAAQPRHVHDSLIMGVVTAGARRIRTGAGETRIGTGEVFALPPGLAHACEPADLSVDGDVGTHAITPATDAPAANAPTMLAPGASCPAGGQASGGNLATSGSSPDCRHGNTKCSTDGTACREACAYFAFSIQAASLPPLALAALPVRIADAALARTLSRLAEAVQQECGSLERQSLLAEALERLTAFGQGSGPGSGPNNGGGDNEDAGQAQPQDAAKHVLWEAVQRAKELLDSESGAECSLPQLAQACGVDMYALHRAFTRAVGLPPHAYQTHLRLRRAKALLRAGASPGEAALEAGFCDQSHLNRHFARLVGLTPAQYARAHKGRGQAARPGRKTPPR